MEASFRLVPSANGSLENRLDTVIQRITSKERRLAGEITKLKEENQKLLNDGNGPSSIPRKSQHEFEATLTRVMQREEREKAELRAQLNSSKTQLDTTTAQLTDCQTAGKNTRDHLETRLNKISGERDRALSDLKETKVQVEDLEREVARSEKGKKALIQTRDQKEREIESIQEKYNTLQRDYIYKQSQVQTLRSELDEKQRSYNRVKKSSLVEDIDKIDKLKAQLEERKQELEELNTTGQDKNQEIEHAKAKIQQLQDENNESLQQVCSLQDELAVMNLSLSNTRAGTGHLEVSLRMVEQERDLIQSRSNAELEQVRQELVNTQNLAKDRQNETDFLRASIQRLEQNFAEQSRRAQDESDLARRREEEVDQSTRRTIELESELKSLKLQQEAYEDTIKQQGQFILSLNQEASNFRGSVALAVAKEAEDRKQQLEKALLSLQSEQREDIVKIKTEPIDDQLFKSSSSLTMPQMELVNMMKDLAVKVVDDQELHEKLQTVVRLYNEQIAQDMARNQMIARLKLTLDSERESHMQDMADMNAIQAETEQGQEVLQEELSGLEEMGRQFVVMEEVTLSLYKELEHAHQVNKELLRADESSRAQIRKLEEENQWGKDQVVKLERDLSRRKVDVDNKIRELAAGRAKLQEQDSKLRSLDDEQRELKKQLSVFETINKEQQEQLNGRERALKRLDQARKTYEKMFESKIANMKEDRALLERRLIQERNKMISDHEQQLSKLGKERAEAIVTAQQAQSEERDSLRGELLVIQVERDDLRTKVDEYQGRYENLESQFQEQSSLLTSYVEAIQQKEAQLQNLSSGSGGGGSGSGGGGGGEDGGEEGLSYSFLLRERDEHFKATHEYDLMVQDLKEIIENQYNILSRSDQNVNSMTSRSEAYMNQARELEVALNDERMSRLRDQQNYRVMIAAKSLEVETLEKELGEKTDALRRREAAATASGVNP
ncbi:hypothetical protein BGW38_000534 [Lunasporangiospora selenospora]|uniref:Uncharacterized protein n=1 Tax=Lunasporangiospora selenospora TaxID=979761 RepID=A0A9P6FVJ2_9FUNG|nr:hypothetical protein BGW38_000534 [Lunasporangiospora selenospora]